MGKLNPFKKPKAPDTAAIQAEADKKAKAAEDAAKQEGYLNELEKLKKQRGRAGNILSGVAGDDTSATKVLLG